eukprot:SAG11_NODE_7266_length_1168_cov_2.024322_2_plen_89_part_00
MTVLLNLVQRAAAGEIRSFRYTAPPPLRLSMVLVTRPDQIVRSTRVLHVKDTRYPRRVPILGVQTKFSSVTVIRHTAAKLASRSAVVR